MKKLIVVHGAPASGKTTLVRYLREQLDVPAIEKDVIKEFIFDTVGYSDREWSHIVGKLSIDFVYRLATEFLKQHKVLIIENAFNKTFALADIEAVRRETDCEVFEVYCYVEESVRRKRFNDRLDRDRHPGHTDSAIGDTEEVAVDAYGPLGFEQRIDIDTERIDVAIDGPDILMKINTFLGGDT